MSDARKPRLGVLLSGSGRTLENLCEYIANGSYLDAVIAVVVGSRACLGIEKAAARGIPHRVIPGELSGKQLDGLVEEFGLDLVVLAGYLRRVPITAKTRGRILNIHPALLPDFGGPGMHGMHVHRAVIEAYQRGEVSRSGCTVHYCDETYDTGAVILQRRCRVTDEDTPESLAAKVFELECEAYPEAISRVLAGLKESR
ncbi:MAG: phosphoribosylglycinamide formyltransferase [Phycisphaerales bacterium]|nr:phosphoribosylglycinamide formyltransferase [Phycisphaerales bacterium]